jgi:hypothetical protein
LWKDIGQDVLNVFFCSSQETIDHLFISHSFARLVWRVVHFTYNIPPPTNINNLFGNWLNGIDKQTKAWIRVGVCALVWAIWITEMRLFLTDVQNQIFYRLFIGRLLQFTCGLTYSLRSRGDLRILDAIPWWRSFRLSSARVAGCTLRDSVMSRRNKVPCNLFKWLIYAETLVDKWVVKLCYLDTLNLVNKMQPCASLWCRGWGDAPISKKKREYTPNYAIVRRSIRNTQIRLPPEHVCSGRRFAATIPSTRKLRPRAPSLSSLTERSFACQICHKPSHHRGGICLHAWPQLCLEEVELMSSATIVGPPKEPWWPPSWWHHPHSTYASPGTALLYVKGPSGQACPHPLSLPARCGRHRRCPRWWHPWGDRPPLLIGAEPPELPWEEVRREADEEDGRWWRVS